MAELALETERLAIRPWSLDDAEALFRIYGDPEVMGWLLAEPHSSPDESRERIAPVIARYEEFGGRMGSWAIVEKSSDDAVGSLLLKPLPNDERVEVGWHLGRRVWGKGYATEAGREALRYGFEDLGLRTIYAIVRPDNARSIRVTERLGMRFIESTNRYHGLDLNLYAADGDRGRGNGASKGVRDEASKS